MPARLANALDDLPEAPAHSRAALVVALHARPVDHSGRVRGLAVAARRVLGDLRRLLDGETVFWIGRGRFAEQVLRGARVLAWVARVDALSCGAHRGAFRRRIV